MPSSRTPLAGCIRLSQRPPHESDEIPGPGPAVTLDPGLSACPVALELRVVMHGEATIVSFGGSRMATWSASGAAANAVEPPRVVFANVGDGDRDLRVSVDAGQTFDVHEQAVPG